MKREKEQREWYDNDSLCEANSQELMLLMMIMMLVVVVDIIVDSVMFL